MAMTPLELVKAARKAIGEDMPDDLCPDDLWGPVKGSGSSRDKSAPATVSPSSISLPGDTAVVGTAASTATTTTAIATTAATSTGSSGRSVSDHLYIHAV